MVRSKIIKDLVNETASLSSILIRTKILAVDLGNDDFISWLNHEIEGYPINEKLPDYRIEKGVLKGSYVKGNYKLTDVNLPLGDMPEEIKSDILAINFTESISGLEELLKNCKDGRLTKTLNADLYHGIAVFNNDLSMCIIAAYVACSSHTVKDILSKVTNRVLDILLLLEKEFGCLDELDLEMGQKTQEDINSINNRINIIVYNDNSVAIGDNNKIEDATIASKFKNTVKKWF